jgi:hypothetical protein
MIRYFVTLCVAVLATGYATSAFADENPSNQPVPRRQVDRDGKVVGEGLSRTGLKRVTSLRYSIILRNADGTESAVDEAKHIFKLGQEFRLVVEADTELFLYVFHESSNGLRSFLVPDRHDSAGYVPRLEPGKPLTIPQDGYFEVTPPLGIERLMVFATPEKRAELTSTEAFTDPTQLTQIQRSKLKDRQDRVFNMAMNVNPAKGRPQRRKLNGPRIRLRGMSWQPKTKRGHTGKTVVVGSYDDNVKPDLFLTIPLSSRE